MKSGETKLPIVGKDRRPGSPQSVTRVIQILEVLSASASPLSLADISRILGTPKSSMAALLRGLADADFVVGSEGSFRLGSGAFGLGSALLEARHRLQTSDIIRESMQRLAQRSGETVIFAVRDEAMTTLTYMDVIESRNAVRFAISRGDRRQLYSTAAGRALLAAEPEDEVARYLRRLKPQRFTSNTETDKRKLAEIIAATRKSGVSQTVDQASDGAAGTAAVIRAAGGAVLGALVVAAPSSRFQHRRGELATLVGKEAATLSRSLGYRD